MEEVPSVQPSAPPILMVKISMPALAPPEQGVNED
jgi:hypothetical protein